jgi:hypothetical protein
MFTDLTSLHLFNGTIKFGSHFEAIRPVDHLTTIRITDTRLVVVPGFEVGIPLQDSNMAAVLAASGPMTSLTLENCTLEATCDCPALECVVACAVTKGAHVRLGLSPPSAAVLSTAAGRTMQLLAWFRHMGCVNITCLLCA